MARPQKPQDALVVNGWYLDLGAVSIGVHGLFETLSGIGKSTGIVEMVDAGTNKKMKLSDQLIDYSEMSLTRTYQGNVIDRAMEALITLMIEEGLSIPSRAVKLHHGKEVFSVVFEGFKFIGEEHPEWNVAGTDKYTVSYKAVCTDYVIL